jgi:hypothetical protein
MACQSFGHVIGFVASARKGMGVNGLWNAYSMLNVLHGLMDDGDDGFSEHQLDIKREMWSAMSS